MDPALYVLIAAAIFFFGGVVIALAKSEKGSLRDVGRSDANAEIKENRYNLLCKAQKWFFLIALLFALAAAATFIVPRWDTIQRNRDTSSQTFEDRSNHRSFFIDTATYAPYT